MIGFDDAALDAMTERFSKENPKGDAVLARSVFNLAMTYDLDYMVSAGILRDGAYTDAYYNEDDAFDFIIGHLTNAHPEWDPDELSDLLDLYTDYHDAYMEEQGLLSWE